MSVFRKRWWALQWCPDSFMVESTRLPGWLYTAPLRPLRIVAHGPFASEAEAYAFVRARLEVFIRGETG